MAAVLTEQRLTWKQIRMTYPDQWVALTDVKYMDDDGINVESAVVICGMREIGRASCRERVCLSV